MAIVNSYNHIGFYEAVMITLTDCGYAVLGMDVRGQGRSAYGGSYPELLPEPDEPSQNEGTCGSTDILTKQPEIAGLMHRKHTIKDWKFLIETCKSTLFPSKKAALMSGGVPNLALIPFLYKYPKVADGVVFCPYFTHTISKLPPYPLLLWMALRHPHRLIMNNSSYTVTTRDQRYVYLSMTSPLAVKGTSMSMLLG